MGNVRPPTGEQRAAIENALKEIEKSPIVQLPRRYLQTWDSTDRRLTFLCQNASTAIVVSSKGTQIAAKSIPNCCPKLRPDFVRKLIAGKVAQICSQTMF